MGRKSLFKIHSDNDSYRTLGEAKVSGVVRHFERRSTVLFPQDISDSCRSKRGWCALGWPSGTAKASG